MGYSPENLNYFRMCHIAVKLVPEGLRKIFKQEWNFLYSATPFGIWKDTAQNGNDFYHKETKGRRPGMTGRFLTIIRNGNTAEWDCSCLFSAILFSNTIGSTLGPAVRNGVDDLRQIRNDIAHIIEDELSDHDFQHYVGRVQNALTCLGLPVTEVEGVKNQTGFPTKEVEDLKNQIGDLKTELDQSKSDLDAANKTLKNTQADLSSAKEENETLTQEINSKIESFCSLTFTPPHEIIRRSSDIRRITGKMLELNDGSKGAVSTIYLSGNPGCGKSQLARQVGELFYSSKSRDTGGLIFVATLNAENLETLSDSYISLAKRLGMTEYAFTEFEKSKRAKPEETLKQVMRIISPKIAMFANWLIIVDNVVDLRLVRSFVPQTASNEWGHGQVLITTQDSGTVPSYAPQTYHESLSEGMQLDDAVNLLKQVSQISDQEHVEMVAKALDCQPLALASAAFFVQTVVRGSPEYNWTHYLDRLRQGQREVTEQSLVKKSSAYSNTMTAAVELAIGRAIEANEVIRQTFCFLSLCASESLPVDIVVDFVMANTKDHTVKELIKTDILESSLIVSSCDEDKGPKYLRLHNIVHDVLRSVALFNSNSTQKEHCIATAISVFEHHLEEHLLTKEYAFSALRTLASHSKVLFDSNFADHDEQNFPSLMKPDKLISWLRYMAQACRKLTESLHADRLSERACSLLQKVPSNEITLVLKSDVFELRGLTLAGCCNYKSALLYHQKALDIKKEIYGEEHRNTVSSYDCLGDVCRQMGKHDQAEAFFQRALAIETKLIDGEDLEKVSDGYYNMAINYNDMREFDQAIKCYTKALSIKKKIHGEEHGDVADTYHNLATTYSNIGAYDKAIKCHTKALSIWKTIHGEEHGNVADAYYSMAFNYIKIGELDQAIECYTKALSIKKKIHGEEHGDVANTYYNLATVYSKIGACDETIECGTKALSILKKIHGEEHGNVANTYYNLALHYRKIGKYDQAIEYNTTALSIWNKIHGEEHGDVANAYYNLATVYSKIGKYDQAIECHTKALSIWKKIHGEEHGNVADAYYSMALNYIEIGELDQAIECYTKALSIKKKIHGEGHGDVANTYYNLALYYSKIGAYDKTIEWHTKALSIRKKIHGEEHGNVANSYYNLATAYSKIGKYDQAIECYTKALSIKKKIHGEEHGDVANTYYNLATAYSKIGKYDQAIECDTKALSIWKKIHGEEHGDVANTYYNLANYYSFIEKYDETMECGTKALNIRKKIHGEEHGDVIKSYCNLAIYYSDMGEYDKAIEYDTKALNIRKKIHGEEHSEVAESYYSLALDYSNTEEYDQAIEYNTKALNIREKIHGEEHSEVAESYDSLALDYSGIGEYDQAIEYYTKALTIWKKIHGEEHGDVADTYYNLATAYRNNGAYDQAIEYETKALNIRKKFQ